MSGADSCCRPMASSIVSRKLRHFAASFLFLVPALASAHNTPHLVAEQITTQNIAHAIRGSSAIAGVGDWMLSNGTLCVSISDPSHETYLSHRGGTLVDLGFCGRDDDRWHTYHEMFNLSRDHILPATSIQTAIDSDAAHLVVRGEISGMQNTTGYRLSLDKPDVLEIETSLTRVAESDRLFLFGSLILHPHRSLAPHAASTTHPEYSKGFHHPVVNTTDKLAMLKVMYPLDQHTLVGPDHAEHPISYRIQRISTEHINRAGRGTPLRQFAINSDEFTLIGNFTNALWFDTDSKPGLVQFSQTPFMDLAVGETLRIKTSITVIPHAKHPDGKSPAPQASATLVLPKGKVMQLVFKGRNGTADPVLFPDALDFRMGGKRYETSLSSNRYSLSGTRDDLPELSLPPGNYTVFALRGPEYSLEQTDITLESGKTRMLDITTPKPAVDSKHWLAADFHVHSEYSFDSTYPVHRRIADFYAQGGEIMVSSEHKRTVNFSKHIHEMQLHRHILALTGVELSGMAHTPKIPRTMGHSNVFPVRENLQAFLGGTLPHENKRLGEIIHDYKQQYPESIFQLNHPRASQTPDADINFFDHLSINKVYDPARPLTDIQNRSLLEKNGSSTYRDIDFDAMELMNGEDLASYTQVRTDWFSLLRQGYGKTGTANSDSHHASQVVALPRNLVRVRDDRVTAFKLPDFLASIRRGDLIGSTGPLLDISLEGKRMGETVIGKRGALTMTVESASWIPVDQLRVYINGTLAHEQNIAGPGSYSVPLNFSADSFVTVEVSGKANSDYAAVYPGFYPFAFSNPVFVDADGNGEWTPPGL